MFLDDPIHFGNISKEINSYVNFPVDNVSVEEELSDEKDNCQEFYEQMRIEILEKKNYFFFIIVFKLELKCKKVHISLLKHLTGINIYLTLFCF